MKLGFTGLDIIDTPMAINLAHAGHQLCVIAIGPVADELPSLGVVNVEAAHQVTDVSDIVFITVPGTSQVKDILFGKNGCTKISLKGKTIVDTNSIPPIETKRFAHQMNELDGDYLDAPVSGGKVGAREGMLSITIGSDEAVFERVKSLFELLSKNITLMGGDDNGQTYKVTNQVIVALGIEAISGTLLFASKAGVGLIRVRQALIGGFASSCTPEVHGKRMIKRIFDPGPKVALHQGDLNLALRSVKTLVLNLPSTMTCQELFNTCMASDGSQLGHSTLMQTLELAVNHKLT